MTAPLTKHGYLGVAWSLQCEPPLRKKLFALLDDYVLPVPDAAPVDFALELEAARSTEKENEFDGGESVVLLESAKKETRRTGILVSEGPVKRVRVNETGSVIRIDDRTRLVQIKNPDSVLLAKEGLRVARDVLKALVESQARAAMFHAAVVADVDGHGIALIGSKGAGKTTISLDLLLRHGLIEISRDRCYFEMESGELVAHGWPSYYNLTPRTLATFNETRPLLPPSLRGLSEDQLDRQPGKTLFLASDLGVSRKRPCTVIDLVFVLQKPDTQPPVSVEDILDRNCFSPHDPNFRNWHGWQTGIERGARLSADIRERLRTGGRVRSIVWKDLAAASKEILDTWARERGCP